MNFLSLFAGIGGFDLGLERAGMTCVGQVEIDPFCRKVLEKHWPDVKRMEDVRDVRGDEFGPIDLICGGFPCQDISVAGRGAGIAGKRSGLWSEYHRIIGMVRPRYVVVENVAALLNRGMGRVLGDLASIGYDAEWRIISAAQAGRPHSRLRIWIVAYPMCDGFNRAEYECNGREIPKDGGRMPGAWGNKTSESFRICKGHAMPIIFTSAASSRLEELGRKSWESESPIQRMVDGIPNQLERIKACGNAIVPHIAEFIGREIMESLSRGPGASSNGRLPA